MCDGCGTNGHNIVIRRQALKAVLTPIVRRGRHGSSPPSEATPCIKWCESDHGCLDHWLSMFIGHDTLDHSFRPQPDEEIFNGVTFDNLQWASGVVWSKLSAVSDEVPFLPSFNPEPAARGR
jgi:hypothetical protein